MATKTDPRNTQHGEEEERPKFGDYSPKINQAQAGELQKLYDESDPEYTPSGDPSDPRGDSRALSGSEIEEAESAGGVADAGTASADEKKSADKHKIPFNPADSMLPPQVAIARKFKRAFKRKRIIPGLAVALIVGLFIFFAGIAQGPLQLIHLSETLEIPMFHNEENTKIRLFKLFTWSRTNEVGTTRLTIQGNVLFPHLKKQMVRSGINLQGTSVRGFLSSATIDTSKPGSLYRGDVAAARARIAADVGIPIDKVVVKNNFGSGAIIEIDASNLTERQKERLISIAVDHTRYGGTYDTSSPDSTRRGAFFAKISNAVVNRWFNIVYAEGQPSWFHPFEKVGRPIDARVGTAVRTSRPVEALKARVDGSLTDAQKATLARVKSKVNAGTKVTAASLGIASGICIAKDISSSLPELNRIKAIIPAMKRAVVLISVGSQIKSGKIPDPKQLGELAKGFKDKDDKTIHNAKAIKVLQNEEGGEDIDPEIKQAFSEDSTSKDVDKALDDIGADTLCGGPGLIAQYAVGTALLFAPGASVAGRFLAAGASSVAVAYIAGAVKNMLAKEVFLGEPFQGPNGGNVAAYGAREYANSSARLAGGLPLSSAQSAAIDQRRLAQEKDEFNSKGLIGRIFDVRDYRSIAGRAVDNGSFSPTENVSKIASGLLSPLSFFTPKISAAEKVDYDWGFPVYGFSDQDINSPVIEDPYENAEDVAKIFAAGDGEDYAEDIKTCFGVEITKDPEGLWSVVTKDDPNPASGDYEAAKCNRGTKTKTALNKEDQGSNVLSASTDDSQGEVLAASTDKNWLKIRGFIIDSKAMDGFSCVELKDDQACKDSGADHIGPSTPDDEAISEGEAPSEVIDFKELGKNSDKLSCADGTKDLGVVTTKYTGSLKQEEGPLKIRLCQVKDIPGNGNNTKGVQISGGATVDARVSGAWAALAKAAKAEGIPLSANSSFRLADSCGGTGDGSACATPGNSPHQTGLAIDFGNGMYGHTGSSTTSCAGRAKLPSNKSWNWLYNNADKYGIKQYTFEAWHWDATNFPNRCGK